MLLVQYTPHMRIDILTLFPAMFHGPLTESILGRASHVVPLWGTLRDRQDDKPMEIHLHDLCQWGKGKCKQVDDSPYGGGVGMVMRADVIVPAVEAVMKDGVEENRGGPFRVYLSPRGKRLTQVKVEKFAKKPWLLLLCGHYEGIDQRVIDGGWIDEEVSIGDYVLTGGELPAMVLIDAVARQLPGVLGKDASAEEESFSHILGRKREYPHYTRPEEFRGHCVPSVLLEGDHAAIALWRRAHTL
ncbi:tRNA (guanosine(37)-N1)-methyltransferase TrmD [Candidatus Peribacteria bacterium RIFCSPLOWO2_12_FULL_55_15]|nr:MAG: tRNA (guanosine(37)-N1)-methyltransferase TrmD [Candidatus Peribacteria bacterium RIFCSPHIGHO2_01_FULL_54_22]OGJ62230.1 MAG: tRNA (guanosine(37)-N1)-methyltransferase TrmD [Candidatus Peribacteria bacterium RIFCSPHIGHO2_02_FULL_55_24]OGJ64703.1 MAG: tRNA (guanosine(37)-N1)-methyltransferase TrmD [Candidatus Peribacteria bacterium RIFCSPHIGHO2_12_FULL_54_10]OGJ67774.1 MAG: tRNA (guanosine(37)-N1)-methyltransferase TrmD [Candidatus Peribacteria bacterium RIFCSPLOWO2_01_FULL_54_110]OGJ6992